MAHLPYANVGAPELQPLVQRIVEQRGSLLHLYQMLMHSPPLTEGWLHFFTNVRQKLELPGRLRELVIMRIACINDAPYEAVQHRPIALREGVVEAQLDALPDWADHASLFSPLEQAVLLLCDTMTREVHVAAPVVQAVRDALGERQTVELVATIASYNMVSRVLEALQIRDTDPRVPG